MKILNIVLCVFILLLAAASAAAAYLLYEKRVQMVNGWGKMATAINQTAVKLEENSGVKTKVSGELSVNELSHLNYAELDGKLDKLKRLAADLVTQRNNLVAAMYSVGLRANVSNMPSKEALTAFATSKTACDKIVAGVKNLDDRQRILANAVVQSAKKVDVNLSAQELRRGNVNAQFGKFNARIEGIRAQFDTYRNALSNISRLAGGSSVTLTDDNYADGVAEVTASVRSLQKLYANAQRGHKAEQGRVAQAKKDIAARNEKIETLRLSLSAQKDEIVQYRRALGLDVEVQPWKKGSVESRKMVRGKVVEVNDKFGYVGIDLGTDTEVLQPLGGKVVKVNPDIKQGMVMIVSRKDAESAAQNFIGKVKLTTVDTDTSIAETLELAPDRKIQVGDDVCVEIAPAAPKAKAGK